jgi:hypothetical protein
MTRRLTTSILDGKAALALVLVALSSSACSDGDAQKSWNALSACLAGPAAQKPLAARVAQLRLIELGNSGTLTSKTGWPARCGASADDLYAALGTDSDGAVLKGKLRERLACSDTKGSCSPPTDSSLISVTTELFEAATSGGLKTESAPGVAAPDVAPAPLLGAPTWKSFSDKPQSLVGPLLTPDGRAILLLKPREGRARPRGCEFSAGFSKVTCFEANAAVPELPVQSIDLVSDIAGVYAAGLTDKGLVAYDLKSGQKSEVRGTGALRLVREGIAVERGDKDEGFQVVLMSGGKAGKPSKLAIPSPVGDPLALGSQVVYLQQNGSATELVAKTLSGGRLKDVVTEQGAFSGTLHGCRRDATLAVAAFAPRAGQHNAKATGGDGKTQVTVALYQGAAWTKPSSVNIPFERGIESDLVCTKSGASLAYAQSVDGGVQVGRVDCDASGCKQSEVKLPGIESKWWWAAGPLGDKTLVMWRSSLGETRFRLAPLGALSTTKDVVAFDAPDFGGPNAGELSPLYSEDGALLIFRGESPVAVHVAPEGSLKVIAP